MTFGNLLMLSVGPFVAFTMWRELATAWRNKRFRPGPAQVWSVSLEAGPIAFWMLIVIHVLLIALAVGFAVMAAMDIWGALGAT